MGWQRLSALLLAACLPLSAEAQQTPTAPEPPTTPPPNSLDVTAAPAEKPAPTDDRTTELRTARDALRRAEGPGDADALHLYGVRQEDGRLLQWMASRRPMEKGAWIGISTSPAAPVLRHQLRLPEGIGLVVDFVQPKSPADEAGVRQYDLLEKLDDQLLVNAEQFAVLVRTFKPGDEVKLTLFREGKRQTLGVKLAEHQVPPIPGIIQFQPRPELPNNFWQHFNSGATPRWQATPMPAAPPGGVGAIGREDSLAWVDGNQVLTITKVDGHSFVTALDKSGKVLYRSPIDTEAQRAAVPREVRLQLDRLKFPSADPVPDKPQESGTKDPTSDQASPAPARR